MVVTNYPLSRQINNGLPSFGASLLSSCLILADTVDTLTRSACTNVLLGLEMVVKALTT